MDIILHDNYEVFSRLKVGCRLSSLDLSVRNISLNFFLSAAVISRFLAIFGGAGLYSLGVFLFFSWSCSCIGSTTLGSSWFVTIVRTRARAVSVQERTFSFTALPLFLLYHRQSWSYHSAPVFLLCCHRPSWTPCSPSQVPSPSPPPPPPLPSWLTWLPVGFLYREF